MTYKRSLVETLQKSLQQGPELLQVVIGPRQVGKTTAALQLRDLLGWPSVVASADVSPAPGGEWIETHWERARRLPGETGLLILDEVQKVRDWSTAVKRCWDEDRREGAGPKVLLLGSSALQLQHGMKESLAGRFFLHRCMHWSYAECREAFGWELDTWLYFGGYPGAAQFEKDPQAWASYVTDSLIETAIARDVIQLTPIHKPALLRELFALATTHPAEILSYTKMLGQLRDAGNTTTLAHYLQLLETAFLVSGLSLYSAGKPRQRAGSPKLIVWNQALINAYRRHSPSALTEDPALRGRLVENAVAAHFLNGLPANCAQLQYWREGGQEMDLVLRYQDQVWGLEVKSGKTLRLQGTRAFQKRFPQARCLLIGSGGIPLEEFLEAPADHFFS